MNDSKDKQQTIEKRKKRNARRRKKRLEQHTGVDWIDPEEGYGVVRGERALWRAVILQMLEDATNNSKKSQDKFARTQARNWLEGNHRDFAIVCDLAGLEVAYVRKKVKHALIHAHQWRRKHSNSAANTLKTSSHTAKVTAPAHAAETSNQSADILNFHPLLKKSA